MKRILDALASSVGKKIVMGLTGLLLVGFLIEHLHGNLKLFEDSSGESFNAYVEFLQSFGPLLLVAELGLAALFLCHIALAVRLTLENIQARKQKYVVRSNRGAQTFGSVTMFFTGALITGYLVKHLYDFRFDSVFFDDPAAAVKRTLSQPQHGLAYLAAAIVLGVHLSHGFRSAFQSIGLSHPRLNPLLEKLGYGLAALFAIGFAAFPHLFHVRLERGRRRTLMAPQASDRLDSKAPSGDIQDRWDKHRFDMKLVNPANKRKFHVIVVGTGLAGASAAASLAELGYGVSAFCIQDSPRRAHSIAAQGGINAAKNYPNDGDSVYRLFYDTVKGGDFRARESNVYRLAQISNNIIDQCAAQGVPFAREYGGVLSNRSFGGAQVSRTFYARGQTGQQLLLGAYSALMRQVGLGKVAMYPRREMLDVVVVDGVARGIITRNLKTGAYERFAADAVVLCTGGYGNVFYLSTNAKNCNVTANWRAYKRGAFFANPCFTQIHPTCIPVSGDYQSKLTLMSESLRNDGRVWVPKNQGDARTPGEIPEEDRDYYLERRYPSFGNLVPRDVASRAAKERCDAGFGVGATGLAVYLDFRDAIQRDGEDTIRQKYGNLFQMYEKITADNPYKVPMRIFPAVHYTMGGLWVDYNLESTLPGLFVLGEANFSDHGANRLGASALMQGLADGYFVVPYTIAGHFAGRTLGEVSADAPEFAAAENDVRERTNRLLGAAGRRSVDSFHRQLGKIVWDHCGMARNADGLRMAAQRVASVREEFWDEVFVPGSGESFNQNLEHAGRVADFLEFAELMINDAAHRMSPAAATSGKSIRPRRAKRGGMTTTSATPPPGSTRATGAQRRYTRSR